MRKYLFWCFMAGMCSYLTSRILQKMWDEYNAAVQS